MRRCWDHGADGTVYAVLGDSCAAKAASICAIADRWLGHLDQIWRKEIGILEDGRPDFSLGATPKQLFHMGIPVGVLSRDYLLSFN